MKDLLLLNVRKFLEKRIVPGKPVLLGYSGGPDSKALLYLLLECRRFFALDLHLVHIDHGWREESRNEALQIQEEAKLLGLPAYVQTLEPKDFKPGNLELQGRDYRYRFFSQVYHRLGCQALVLGHHADDQAEIVLKRVFEGASLFAMGGITPESQLEGMQLWRPLLMAHKKEVVDWLSQKKISFFLDPTNSSDRFLRGRMREELLPLLQKSFGKEVSSNLCRIGEESREVKDYFCELNRAILATIREEPGSSSLDLRPFLPLPMLQLKYLLREWMGRERVTFSRQIIEGIVSALVKRTPERNFNQMRGPF